nr:hypothetical protein [Tanacetum cinerariifolium]
LPSWQWWNKLRWCEFYVSFRYRVGFMGWREKREEDVQGRGNRGSTRATTVQAGGIGANNGISMIEELSNLIEIVQCPVELPDGNIAMTKKKGDVCFDNGFILKNVLYDLTSRTMIGAGKRRDGGLFYFQEVPTTRVFKTTTTAIIPFEL